MEETDEQALRSEIAQGLLKYLIAAFYTAGIPESIGLELINLIMRLAKFSDEEKLNAASHMKKDFHKFAEKLNSIKG